MSNLFLIEFYSVKDPRFKEVLEKATVEELKNCFAFSSIQKHTEKCCRIYAELRRKRRSEARKAKLSALLGADQK